MTDRPLPQPGDLYRHYKGEKVAHILGIARASESAEFMGKFTDFCSAKSASDDIDHVLPIKIKEDGSGRLRYLHNEYVFPIVVYFCTGAIWARPLDEFMEVISGESNYYRFTLIPDNFWDTPVERGDQGSIADLMRKV